MKTYIIGAPYSVQIENENWNYGYKGYSAFNYGDTHFFKCDLDLSDLPGSLEKIQSRCKKMSRNLNGCKISFDQQPRRTVWREQYNIHTPTEELLRTFVAGDWVDTDLPNNYDDITETVTLSKIDSQNTVRSKIERSIYLRSSGLDTIAQYKCHMDRYGEFIKEVA